ncbi:GAF domain-containing protein [Paradesulfitobacterium ferrireducens]|uniref:GAF domain-containing protein n=1 Tax=Paradesulfitobacterium ferrireducens TaxID=2816476 RepID=UPI001A8D6EFB|nr:GAF domain-containing protein [Paradesulfitobacterium ferrireducens]
MKKKTGFLKRDKVNSLQLDFRNSLRVSKLNESLESKLSENFKMRPVLESLKKLLSLDFAGVWLLSSRETIKLLDYVGFPNLNPEIQEFNSSGEKSGIINILSYLDSVGLKKTMIYPLIGTDKVIDGWLILGGNLTNDSYNRDIQNLANIISTMIHNKQKAIVREQIHSIVKKLRLFFCIDILKFTNEELMRECLASIFSSGLFENTEILLKQDGGYTYVTLTEICSYQSSNSIPKRLNELIRNAEEKGSVNFIEQSSTNHKGIQVCSIPIYGLKNEFLGLVNLYCNKKIVMFNQSQIIDLESIGWLFGQLLEWAKIHRKKEDTRKKLMSLQFALQKVSANFELSEVLSEIVKLAAQTLSVNLSWISLVKKETTFLRPDAFVGLETEYINKIQVTIDDSVTSKGPSGKAIKTKEPQLVRDTQLDPDFGPWREQTGQYGYRSILAVPILFDNKALGMIAVYSSEVDAFSAEDIEILQAFADFSAVAINNACLIDELQQRLKKEQEMCRIAENHTILLEDSVNVFRELSRLLLEGQTIEAMIITLARLVGNPVRVEDRRKVVFWESELSEDFPPIEQILKHPTLARERSSLSKRLEPVYLQANANRGYSHDILVAPIVLGQEVWGYISIYSSNTVINKFGFMVIDKAATVLGMALLKEKMALEINDQLGRGFLQDLVEGIKSKGELLREAGYFNYDLTSPSYGIVIDVGVLIKGVASAQSLLRLKTLESLRSYLKSYFEFSLVVANDRFALILIDNLGTQDRHLSEKVIKDIKQVLINYVPDNNSDFFTMILAGLVTGVNEIRTAFIEATQHIEIARLLNKHGQILTLEELGIYALIYNTYQKEGIGWLEQFVSKHLGKLLLKDRHKVMIETLQEFVNFGKHVDQIARKLFTHPNTISYRIKKIEELLEVSFDNQEQVHKIILAFKGYELLRGLMNRSNPQGSNL